MKKIVFCVLFGGRSSEYEVSLQSAYSVLTNADPEKYDIIPVGITRNGIWLHYTGAYESIRDGSWCSSIDTMTRVTVDLTPDSHSLLFREANGLSVTRVPVDVVFPVLHGAYGEDGTVQGMLALAGIPCIGCGSASSAVCMDKALTKEVVRSAGIRQAQCVVLRKNVLGCDFIRGAEIAEAELSYPMFVKPARTGSSVGVTKAKTREDLLRAIEIAFREDDKILIEETIVGREIEVAVLEEKGIYTVSECAEIDAGAEFYDYEAKYISNTSSYYIPARLPDDIRAEVRRRAELIFRTLECNTLSRVDFFVCDNGDIVFNEINTLPGFTSISMYPKLMMHAGLKYSELIDRLIHALL